jgi:hypothetical protein
MVRIGDEAGIAIETSSQDGGIAQLGERLLCKQEVVGSIPSASTTITQVQRHPMRMASVRSLTSFIGREV